MSFRKRLKAEGGKKLLSLGSTKTKISPELVLNLLLKFRF